MEIAIELDDFSPKNTNFGLLEDLKDHFPNFKITLFTVPWEIRWGEPTPITLEKFRPFCEAVKKSKDWIEIAIHGLTHHPKEFENISYDEAKKRILVAEKMLINRSIDYAKIFKPPHWLISEQGKKAVKDLGFILVEDGYYHWNLKDERPKKKGIIIAHGHIQDTMGNGLEMVMPKLLKLPVNTKFYFLSEVLKAEKVDAEEALRNFPKL